MARLVKRKAAVSAENAEKKTRRNAPAAEPRTSEIVIGERLASSVSAIVAGAPVTPASLAEQLMVAAKRVPKPAEQTPPREIENAARLITNALRSLCGPGSAVEVDESGSEEEDRAVASGEEDRAVVPMSGGGGDVEVEVVVSMDVLGTVPVSGNPVATPDTSSGPVSSASAPAPTNVRLAVPCSQTGQPSCATPSSPTPVSPDGDVDGSDNTSSWLSDILEGCDEGPNTSTSGMCGPQPVIFGGSTDGVEASSDDSKGCSARNEQQPQVDGDSGIAGSFGADEVFESWERESVWPGLLSPDSVSGDGAEGMELAW